MKPGIHPNYHPVIFIDGTANTEFISRSTMTSNEIRTIDGVDHHVIRLEISSDSHPYYTGRQHFIDTAGRIDKFRRRYGQG
jgi:large subunit ribosomal protein L31